VFRHVGLSRTARRSTSRPAGLRACSSRARSVVARVASCPCNLTHTHSPSDNNKYLLINPQGGGGRGRQHDRKLEHVLGRSHNVRTGAPAALTVG
jgi:hypothetical protein